jgi:hypothetical protein
LRQLQKADFRERRLPAAATTGSYWHGAAQSNETVALTACIKEKP